MTTNPRVPFRMASDRAPLPGPDGRNLIIQVVVNVENWRFDQPMPRKLITAPHGADAVPDVPNFSWAEYGMRVGMPRLLRILGDRNLAVGCTINAGVIHTYPRLAGAIREAGWEFIGHGLHQKALTGEASEAALIEQALGILQDFTGRPVQGWLGPGLRETHDTPDILKANGLRYVSDWVLDDAPNWMATRHGPLIAMPYSLEINDSPLYAIQSQPTDEMLDRTRRTVKVLAREAQETGSAKVLTVALHPHLVAVAHRIDALAELLDLLIARDDTVFMTGGQIADWYETVETPEAALGTQAPAQKRSHAV
jgi:peptidoglycan/xylan/chitin deacetylase (PgdA/CDA1 family)